MVVISEGFKEAAEKFRMESGIEPSVDLETLDERIKIREMLLKGQIQEAIALINSLHPELLDTNRYLYFHLQVSGLAGTAPSGPAHGSAHGTRGAGDCVGKGSRELCVFRGARALRVRT